MEKTRLSITRRNTLSKGISAVLCLFLMFSGLNAQAQSIVFSKKHMPLSEAFALIEAQTSFTIAYNEAIVDVNKSVATDISARPLLETLDYILKDSGVSYKIQGSQIMIVQQKVAQAVAVKYSGIVLDAAGMAVVGATVFIKGTTNAVSTDGKGQFEILATQGSIITITSIGYSSTELKLTKATNLKISLSDDTQLIDEVVVVGYGIQNKRDVSTSISSVKSDQIANIPQADFRNALAGKMPGVQVIQPSGDPEGRVSIRVRGMSTVTAGSEPLYIIDGMPVERGFSNINSNDIESIEVLKDASSSAIYGSRGSNGVIIITTKKGKSERLNVQYDGYYGVQSVSKKIDMMNAYQFALAAKDAHDNAYLDANPGGSSNDPNSMRPNSWERIPPELFPYLAGEQGLTDTDWQDAIFRTASTTSQNISLSGKGKSVSYFISGNYYRNEGVVINSDFEKYSARMNLDGNYNKFKFGVNFSPSFSTSNRVNASGVNGVVQSALMMPPVWPVSNPDGSYNYQGNGYWRIGTDYQHNAVLNPVAMADLLSDVVDRMSVVGKVFAEYEIIKGLSYNISLGGDYYGTHNDLYHPSTLPLLGYTYHDKPSNPVGYSSSGFYFNWLLENKLSYSTTFGEKHRLNAIFVQSAQKETYKGNSVEASNYPNDYIQTISGGVVTAGSSNKTQWSLASYLVRANYSFDGKYIFSGAIRADGSSRFGKDNRWGYFPSASFAWRVSDEPFFRSVNSLLFIEDMKLRISYGITGNFNIGNYDHLATLVKDDYVLGSGDGKQSSGYKPERIENNDLRWEKNKMANVGVDIMMFGGLLGVTADYYNTNTSDMLLTVPVPSISGHSSTLMNIGKVNNRGWELLLTSQRTFTNKLSYTFSANYSRNVNEVKALGPGGAPIINTGGVNHAYYITQIGQPIGSYYLLVQDGIFANEEELKQYPHFDNTRVGDFRFVDVDGDGVLDLNKDRTIVGNYMPDFTYGFSGTVAWKGVDFAFNFQGVQGNEILNLNQRYINNMEGNVNMVASGVNRWRSVSEPGDGNTNRANRKATGYNVRTSTWHIEDGSYLRLQNISLGYTLPRSISKKFLVEKLRIYGAVQNLWTLTGYSGYNPEVSARPNKATTPGEDYGTYPLARTFTIGLNITF